MSFVEVQGFNRNDELSFIFIVVENIVCNMNSLFKIQNFYVFLFIFCLNFQKQEYLKDVYVFNLKLFIDYK